MRIFGIAILMLSATLADAVCDDTEIQSVGGSGEATTNHRLSGLSEGIRDNAFNRDLSGYELNSDLDCITVSGEYPGPGWSWVGNFHWMFIGGGGGGGGAAVVPSQAKLDYCKQQEARDNLEAILSATRITSSVMTGLSVAEASGDFANAYFSSAYQDINRFLNSGTHIDGGYTAIITNWAVANINWGQYLSNWNEVAPRVPNTNNPQAPSFNNGGYKHIFATHLMSLGLGSGETSDSTASSAADSFMGTDPEPNIPC